MTNVLTTWMLASNTLYGNVDGHYQLVGEITYINWKLQTLATGGTGSSNTPPVVYHIRAPHRPEAWEDLFKYSIEMLDIYPTFNLYEWVVIGNCLAGISDNHPAVIIGSESEGKLDNQILTSRVLSYDGETRTAQTDTAHFILGESVDRKGMSKLLDAVNKAKSVPSPKTECESNTETEAVESAAEPKTDQIPTANTVLPKKKEFEFQRRVKIVRTGSEFDGKECTVVGISTRHIIDHYIVLFDTPQEVVIDSGSNQTETWQALTLPESCLE